MTRYAASTSHRGGPSPRLLAMCSLLLARLIVIPHAAGAAAPAPSPASKPRLEIFSNANEVAAVAVHDGRLYAATGGGVVAWDLSTGRLIRKWTALDGLLGNRAYAITVCGLPEPKLVVGMSDGLNLYDLKKGVWETLEPVTSRLAAGSITSLASDSQRGMLGIGYGYAGVNVVDGRSDTWLHFATVNGLPANRVEGLAFTRDGKQLWVSSGNGITQVDGNRLKAHRLADIGITAPLSGAIASDAPGSVWAITVDGTLVRCSEGRWKVYGAEIPGTPLRARGGLVASPDGSLWFANSKGEVCRFDPATSACVPVGKVHAADGVCGPIVVADRVVFVPTREGVEAMDTRREGAWRRFTVAGDALRSNRVRALIRDKAGAVWIGTDAGVYTIASSTPGAKPRPLGKPGDRLWRSVVTSFYIDPAGGMWMGTLAGAGHFDGSTWTWRGRADGLASDTVRAIARDSQGRLWFGTYWGLSVWDGRTTRTYTLKDGIQSEQINALLPVGDLMYVATDRNMLRFEGDRFEILDDDVMGVEFESMYGIVPYTGDSLAVATSDGLGYMDGRKGRDDPTLYGDAVVSLSIGVNGEIWAGTELRGVWHRAGGEWERLTTSQGMASNRINAVLADRKGTAWIGTRDAGLVRLAR